MGTINERVARLAELHDLEVAEGDPDVRGWQVHASDGATIGVVDELLIDVQALRVRYLDVRLDPASHGDSAGHVLLPVGVARLHESDDRILVEGLGSETLRELPPYRREPLTHDYESALLRHFQPPAGASSADLPGGEALYDTARFHGARRVRLHGRRKADHRPRPRHEHE